MTLPSCFRSKNEPFLRKVDKPPELSMRVCWEFRGMLRHIGERVWNLKGGPDGCAHGYSVPLNLAIYTNLA